MRPPTIRRGMNTPQGRLRSHETNQIADVSDGLKLVDHADDVARPLAPEHRLDQPARLLVHAVGIERVLLGAGRVACEVRDRPAIAQRDFHPATTGSLRIEQAPSATSSTRSFTASTCGSFMRAWEWLSSNEIVPSMSPTASTY